MDDLGYPHFRKAPYKRPQDNVDVFRKVPPILGSTGILEPDDSEDAGLAIENLQQIQDC